MKFVSSFKSKLKGIPLKMVLVVAVFLSLLFVFIFITDEIVLEKENGFDLFVFDLLSAITNKANTKIMSGITFLGSRTFLWPAYTILCLYYLFYEGNKSVTINIITIALTSAGLLFFLKRIFERTRPLDPVIEQVSGFSYPSGHTFSSFTFFGLLIYATWQKEMSETVKWILSIIFFSAAFLVGVSRVYLHVHFASDVVAAFCLSMIWLILSLWGLNKFEKWRRKKRGNLV